MEWLVGRRSVGCLDGWKGGGIVTEGEGSRGGADIHIHGASDTMTNLPKQSASQLMAPNQNIIHMTLRIQWRLVSSTLETLGVGGLQVSQSTWSLLCWGHPERSSVEEAFWDSGLLQETSAETFHSWSKRPVRLYQNIIAFKSQSDTGAPGVGLTMGIMGAPGAPGFTGTKGKREVGLNFCQCVCVVCAHICGLVVSRPPLWAHRPSFASNVQAASRTLLEQTGLVVLPCWSWGTPPHNEEHQWVRSTGDGDEEEEEVGRYCTSTDDEWTHKQNKEKKNKAHTQKTCGRGDGTMMGGLRTTNQDKQDATKALI